VEENCRRWCLLLTETIYCCCTVRSDSDRLPK
jgi:hypothetical protein